jgi:hypothetical protein
MADPLMKVSSDVAAVMKAILQLSDDAAKGTSPLDTQGKLLRLQNSIQKNRTRIVGHVEKLCDLIEASGGKLAV